MAFEKTTPVAVVMGSDSDWNVMQGCVDQLREFGVEPKVRILSAHRTPQAAAEFAQTAEALGIKVIIAAAGMAAHLAGALAAWTTLPVIGVPLTSEGGLAGMDALLSTVQMPPGVPVATVAIGKAGARTPRSWPCRFSLWRTRPSATSSCGSRKSRSRRCARRTRAYLERAYRWKANGGIRTHNLRFTKPELYR